MSCANTITCCPPETFGYTAVDPCRNIVPAMTSNTTPDGEASADSVLGTANKAFKAFDHLLTVGYWSPSNTAYPHWVQYKFPFAKTIKSYAIYKVAAIFAPSAWTVQGSNNGSTWTTIDTRSAQTWTGSETHKEFNITTPGSYQYYRFNFTSNQGPTPGLTVVQIREITMSQCTL